MPFYNTRSDTSNFVVSFSRNPMGDFGAYAKGYRSAGEKAAQDILEGGVVRDYDAYPVVFLLRHAFELSLKHVLYSGPMLQSMTFGEENSAKLRNTHNVQQLALHAKTLCCALFPDEREIESLFQRVVTTANELAQMDPQAHAFRYPIDTRGAASTNQHTVVNLGAFVQHMTSVLEELETLHFGIDMDTQRSSMAYEVVKDLLGTLSL